ncbi:MAG TPA: nucleotide exchange factor GrpE [Verrucomicrobiae bacterium]|nr:nucleotide exchange factor GrpE [Verrucomicrobiae bacterium]
MSAKNKHTKPEPASAPVAEAPPKTDAPPAEPEVVDSISVEELATLKAKAATADENWDKFLRAAADLENYRKRVAREKEELARFTSERVVAALLPVLDNLERAIDAAQKHGADNSSLLEGITQVYGQFRRSLVEFGLQEVIANAGHPFDPNLHEAVSQIESGEHPEGHVVEQLQRGYKLADRLLRPARVIVSKGRSAETEPTAKTGAGPKKSA